MERYLISTNKIPFAFDISNYSKEVLIDFSKNTLLTKKIITEEIDNEKIEKVVDVEVKFEPVPDTFKEYILKPKLLEFILILIATIVAVVNIVMNFSINLLGIILVSFILSFIIYLGYLVISTYSFLVSFSIFILFLILFSYVSFVYGFYKMSPVFLQIFIITIGTLHFLSKPSNLYKLANFDGLYFSVINKIEELDEEIKEVKEVKEVEIKQTKEVEEN